MTDDATWTIHGDLTGDFDIIDKKLHWRANIEIVMEGTAATLVYLYIADDDILSDKPTKNRKSGSFKPVAGPVIVRAGVDVYRTMYEPIFLSADPKGATLPEAFMPHMAGRFTPTMALPAA